MKTAKEVCEELKNEKVNYIISKVLTYGGECTFMKSYNVEIIKKHKSTLENLGYKVDLKIRNDTITRGLFFWKTEENYKSEYCIVSACCGEEK